MARARSLAAVLLALLAVPALAQIVPTPPRLPLPPTPPSKGLSPDYPLYDLPDRDIALTNPASLTPPSYEHVIVPPVPEHFCSEAEREAKQKEIQHRAVVALLNWAKADEFLEQIDSAIVSWQRAGHRVTDATHAMRTAVVTQRAVFAAMGRALIEEVDRVAKIPVIDCKIPDAKAVLRKFAGEINSRVEVGHDRFMQVMENASEAFNSANTMLERAAKVCDRKAMRDALARMEQMRDEFWRGLQAAEVVGLLSQDELANLQARGLIIDAVLEAARKREPENCPKEPARQNATGGGELPPPEEDPPLPPPPAPPPLPPGGQKQQDMIAPGRGAVGGGYIKQDSEEQRKARLEAIERLRTGAARSSGTDVAPGFPETGTGGSRGAVHDAGRRLEEAERHGGEDRRGNADPQAGATGAAGRDGSVSASPSVEKPPAPPQPPPPVTLAPPAPPETPAPPVTGIAGTWRLSNTASGVSSIAISSDLIATGMGPAIRLERNGDTYFGEGAVLFGQGGHTVRISERGGGNAEFYAENGRGGSFRTTMTRQTSP